MTVVAVMSVIRMGRMIAIDIRVAMSAPIRGRNTMS
jgi:hypothetical protein